MDNTGPPQPPAGPPPPPWPGQPPQPWPGQPQQWAAPYVAPPPPNWGPPPPAPRRVARWLIPVIIVCSLLGLCCLGAIGRAALKAGERAAATSERNARELSDLFPATPPATPEDTGTEPAGPEASTYPVREDKDLERVCDNVYYPQSPKYAGAAPHQISIGVVDSKDFPSRFFRSYMDVPYSLPEKVRNAWRPKDLGKTQLMACVDLVSTGAQVKKCTFDDPKPEQIVMKRGNYRLRLYEVATGRKLLEKQLAGSDKDCPTMVLLGSDRTLRTAVADRDLYELLRSYVMKK